MQIKYQLFENDYLLIQKFIGVFSLEEYLGFNRYVNKEMSVYSIKKVLNDFRELKLIENDSDRLNDFNINLQKVIEVRKNIIMNEPKTRDINLVFLVDDPRPTVMAHSFVNYFSGMNYNYCSSTSKAIQLLNLPDLYYKLDRIIENLEMTVNIGFLATEEQ
jgi:hypothetical protein